MTKETLRNIKKKLMHYTAYKPSTGTLMPTTI